MPNRIKPKRSYTANAVPLTTDLETNELAINWADSKAFTKNAAGQIVSVTLGGGGGGGSLSATVTIPASGDQYWENTTLLVKGDGVLADSSKYQRTITTYGGVTASGTAKYGSGSLSFSADGDYLSAPAAAGVFAGGDFTVEAWVRLTSYAADNASSFGATVASRQVGGDHAWSFLILGTSSSYTTISFTTWPDMSNPQGASASHSFSLNQWYHVAASKSNGKLYIFVDGVLLNAGGTTVGSIRDSSTEVRIGRMGFDNTYKYQLFGQLDDVRLSAGVGRYTANFTPPTATYATGTYTAAQTLPVVFSDAAPAITISSQPTNQTAASGAATFGVTATVSPSGTATYQWERSDDGGSTFSAVSGATSATLALTGLTNASDDNDRYRVVVSAVGAASVTSNAVTLTVAASTPPLALAGTRPSNLASGTTSNGYTLTGTGTSASPSVLRIGGGNNNDYRVWLIVNQTGTLNWTVTASSEDGYDGGRLYSAGAPANYTPGGFNDATPAGYTAVSNWLSGSQTQTGTTSVTAGQHIVLRWARDDGGDGGNNRIELSAYMS